MFAILKTGGKQYKVAKDDVIQIEKLDYSEGDSVKLTEILLIEKDGGDVLFGAPFIDGGVVEGQVVKNYKDKKVIIFKKRRRQNSRRKNGHRQTKTELKITDIKFN
ncbi:MAG: large subunit ribosomal protein L21 [Rickettsiales bacterium]|jgi:large subunit ribosomal protein L21